LLRIRVFLLGLNLVAMQQKYHKSLFFTQNSEMPPNQAALSDNNYLRLKLSIKSIGLSANLSIYQKPKQLIRAFYNR